MSPCVPIATESHVPWNVGDQGKSGLVVLTVMAAAQSGNLSIGGIISQLVAGGAGGAILTAIVGAIKNKAAA